LQGKQSRGQGLWRRLGLWGPGLNAAGKNETERDRCHFPSRYFVGLWALGSEYMRTGGKCRRRSWLLGGRWLKTSGVRQYLEAAEGGSVAYAKAGGGIESKVLGGRPWAGYLTSHC